MPLNLPERTLTVAPDHPLAGCIGKLERADEHLVALDEAIGEFLASQPHEFVAELDVEAEAIRIRIRVERDPPLRWSLLLGDVVHNLSSALDHLIWQLVIANGEKPGRDNAFPIVAAEPNSDYERAFWERRLRGVSAEAIAVVEVCQPYSGPQEPKYHPLTSLRALSNEDKHRAILARLSAIGEPSDPSRLPPLEVHDLELRAEAWELYVNRPLSDGDIIASIPVTVTGSEPSLRMVGELPFEPGFGSRMVTMQAVVQIRNSVNEVIDLFAPLF